MFKCSGQCFDGAGNMSGKVTGLQTRIKECEKSALFVHCHTHVLNLVFNDAVQNILTMRNFINMNRDLITFIRASAKRFSGFKNIDGNTGANTERSNLRSYRPTRWFMRVQSLKSVLSNYSRLLKTLQEISKTEKDEVGAKADMDSTNF